MKLKQSQMGMKNKAAKQKLFLNWEHFYLRKAEVRNDEIFISKMIINLKLHEEGFRNFGTSIW